MNDQPVFRKELEQYMDAYLPILYVDTLENGKVQDILAELAAQKGRGIIKWSLHSGYEDASAELRYPSPLSGALDTILTEKTLHVRFSCSKISQANSNHPRLFHVCAVLLSGSQAVRWTIVPLFFSHRSARFHAHLSRTLPL